jgi:Zn-finger nucleic acid-binding protein
MQCPSCKSGLLVANVSGEGLRSRVCNQCEGRWISSTDYWKWLEQHGERLPESDRGGEELVLEDSADPKICPDCGHIMFKYQVGHGLGFKLDHCDACNGVWFDRNEWDVLKSRNLHDEVHLVFSAPWQSEVKAEERARAFEILHRAKFGEDYERLKEFKRWIDGHEQRSSILAFLASQ